MVSTFSWLDHSDTERRRVLDAIDRFKESETRDELGLGGIRDALADLFFPGTSVIQTRARYFLFVPWMYLDLERRKAAAAEIETRTRRAETHLIEVLKTTEDKSGNIGSLAGATLKRLPSNVYWLGLRAWGIRLIDGSQDDYYQGLDRFYAQSRNGQRDDDGEALAGSARRHWHAGLPEPPEGYPDSATFMLPRHEAQYLVDRIRMSAPRSLLAFLAVHGAPADVEFVWEHPQLGTFPGEVRAALVHAQLLAETMQGAAWLYNVLLAEERAATGGGGDAVELFRDALGQWASEIEARRDAIAGWDRRAFFRFVRTHANVSVATETFVEEWLRLAPWNLDVGGAEHAPARELIARRERQLKGPRARLGNLRALELWGGESGTGRLDYRWRAARRLLADLYLALGRGGEDAAAQ